MTNEELEKRLNKLESFMLSTKARLQIEDEINADLLTYIEADLKATWMDSGRKLASTLQKSLLGRRL